MKLYLKRILIAEDDPSSRHILTQMLQKWGYEVTVCVNGAEALESLRAKKSPQLALLDWMMPEMNGLEVSKALRETLHHQPIHIIMMTSKSESGDIVSAMQAGADDYIFKPIDYAQLRARLLIGFKSLETQRNLEVERLRNLKNASLVSLGVMAGGVAHEINNPLNVILGYNSRNEEALKAPQVDVPSMRRNSERIATQVHRISQIVSGLLRFAREANYEVFEVKDLNQLVEECLAMTRGRLEAHGVRLQVDGFIEEDLSVECQAAPLCQAVLNLISNAFDAIKDAEEKWIKIGFKRIQETMELSITDSGSGVSEEIKDRIMEPFFTTKEVGQGVGLGLSMANVIVEAHQGVLYYNENVPNTQFVMAIPRRQKAKVSQAA